MTPDDFRAARKQLGLTQHQLAERLLMGAHGWQSVSAWERGERPIPGPVQVAMECLVKHGGV